MRTLSSATLMAMLLAGAASAQRLAAYDPLVGTTGELQPPTALLAVANPPLIIFPVVPALPALPPPAGDATFDNVIGLVWYTNGAVLAAMPISVFPPLGPIPGPFAIPPALLALLGGPVTGIAIDPVAGIMFMTSLPGIVVGVSLVPGLPIVVGPFPAPPPAGPITGLEWDGATGTLWAVDLACVAVNFLVGGILLPPVLPPSVPPPGPGGDIAIDKIGTTNPVGLRPLYIAAGPLVFDTHDPLPIVFPAGPPSEGLAFANHPAAVPILPGCEGCPGAYPGPSAFTTSVMAMGNAVFAVGMGGLVPGFFGIFAFDSVVGPVPFPLVNGPAACPLGLTLSPTLILVIGGPADPAGNVLLPVSLAAVPVGTFLHNQNFTFCGAQPTGIAFSRFQTITSGGL